MKEFVFSCLSPKKQLFMKEVSHFKQILKK